MSQGGCYMGSAKLTLIVQDDYNIRVERDDGAQTKGKLILDDLHRNLISLFEDWLSREKQSGQDRKMSRRWEFEVFGTLLYKVLFDGQVEIFFRQTLEEVKEGERLRVQLSFEGRSSDLASIPWEY